MGHGEQDVRLMRALQVAKSVPDGRDSSFGHREQFMSQLHLSLLGTPKVQHGEHTLTFSTRKALALLVYLAVEGGMHARKTLSEAFWPEVDAEHGRTSLRATLLELRKLLERSHGPNERAHLLVERDILGFDQGSPLILDLHLVEPASKQIGRGIEPLTELAHEARLSQLEDATRQVRGPFLAGFTLRDSQFFDDWTRQQREYWHLRIQQLFDTLSMGYEQMGDVERAIDAVTRWLHFDPLNEEGYRRLMRLRFSQGDRAGALRAYTNGRAVLAEHLHIEPEPETVALAKRIRHTAPVRSTPFHGSFASHTSPGLPSTHLLDSAFQARTTEWGTLIECYQRVAAGQPQVVLLEGETGIGKTHLARAFAGWAQAQGAAVLLGAALPTARPLPYQPLIDILRREFEQEGVPDDLGSPVWLAELSRLLPELRERSPDLPTAMTDEMLGPTRLFEAITRLLRRWVAVRPLVLVLEDMQWADPGTLDLLLYLSHSLAEHPVPLLVVLTLRPDAAPCSDARSSWLMALKRSRIPLTTLLLAPFTHEETQRFIQALAWAEQPVEVSNNGSLERCPEGKECSTSREALVPFAHWLYVQTRGQPLYLVETLKGLLAHEIMLPVLQENGVFGLMLLAERLAHTPESLLIPSSVRELIRSQLARLTPSAWTLLGAGAVLRHRLTFEQLCRVAQLDEQEGVRALEEVLRSGLLREETLVEEAQTVHGYAFPCEMIREVVYQEVGEARQRLLQQRVLLVMREKAEGDHDEEVPLPHPTPGRRQTCVETRNGHGRRCVARAVSGERRRAGARSSWGATRRVAGKEAGEQSFLTVKGTSGQGAPDFPRSPPGSPSRVLLRYIEKEEHFPWLCL
jgi:DNA-binding SARP family transcriptional activator